MCDSPETQEIATYNAKVVRVKKIKINSKDRRDEKAQ